NVIYGNYELEPMTVAQILAIGRVQQWDLSNTMSEDIGLTARTAAMQNAENLGTIPPGSLQDMFRSEPPDHATILKPGEPFYQGPGARKTAASKGVPAPVDAARIENLKNAVKRIETARKTISGGTDKPFSNNWILAPSMTASGVAILCNDPHLGLSNPSIFYPLHGDNRTLSNGPLNFSGCTFPGVPGLMLGQNEWLAWGGTVVNYDVTDVYEEEVTIGEDEQKYVTYYGELVPVETTHQRFTIRDLSGGESFVDIDIDFVPHHGPQLPGDPYAEDPGLTQENNLTVQWTGHYVTKDLAAFTGLLESKNIDEFFDSVENFGVGAQNFVGADINGEIAYFPHALVPIRKAGALTHEHPPWMILPGTGGYEWETDEQGRP
ncbi:MAG: penicillin acylase family protein, partial [Thermodesulfobacteriota bacterium]